MFYLMTPSTHFYLLLYGVTKRFSVKITQFIGVTRLTQIFQDLLLMKFV